MPGRISCLAPQTVSVAEVLADALAALHETGYPSDEMHGDGPVRRTYARRAVCCG